MKQLFFVSAGYKYQTLSEPLMHRSGDIEVVARKLFDGTISVFNVLDLGHTKYSAVDLPSCAK